MQATSFWTEADLISVYTRKQAIEDGVLVDLRQDAMTDICQQHYGNTPVACTYAVFAIMQKAVENKHHCNDYAGILHDMLWMSKRYHRTLDEYTRIFRVIIKGAGRQSVYDLKLVWSPDENDCRRAVMTIMLPGES